MYYLQVDSTNKVPTMLWYLKDGVALRVGVPGASAIPAANVTLLPREDIFQAMERQFSNWYASGTVSLHKVTLKPGEYYPRIARPSNAHPKESLSGTNPDNSQYKNEIALLKGQFISLINKLNEICRTIHPDNAITFSAYGHEIRNLLILACTEAESHWRGILQANGLQKAQYSTQDYVKLVKPLRLDEYEVAFPNYPWLTPIRPFGNWGKGKSPSQDIEWYAAYNAVKHDRDNHFPQANLGNAFKAVTACAILLYAQFGARGMVGRNTEILNSFHFIKAPEWSPSEVYILPVWEGHIAPWTPINYPF